MPTTYPLTLYQYDELDEKAQTKARDWFRTDWPDYDWWENTIEDAVQCLRLLGFIDLEPKDVMFSGFSSQGDGASFTGAWHSLSCDVAGLREHAPTSKYNTPLRALADEIEDILRPLRAVDAHCVTTITRRSHAYAHERTVEMETTYYDAADAEMLASRSTDEAIDDWCRDCMRWIYQQLEAEYEYLTGDEAVTETLKANQYTFTKNGRRMEPPQP